MTAEPLLLLLGELLHDLVTDAASQTVGQTSFASQFFLHLQQFLSHRLRIGHEGLLRRPHVFAVINLRKNLIGSFLVTLTVNHLSLLHQRLVREVDGISQKCRILLQFITTKEVISLLFSRFYELYIVSNLGQRVYIDIDGQQRDEHAGSHQHGRASHTALLTDSLVHLVERLIALPGLLGRGLLHHLLILERHGALLVEESDELTQGIDVAAPGCLLTGKHLGSHIVLGPGKECLLVGHGLIERAMGEQEGMVVALAHKDIVGRIAELEHALLIELGAKLNQRFHDAVHKPLAGQGSGILVEERCQRQELSLLQFEFIELVIAVLMHLVVELLLATLAHRPLLFLLQGFAEHDTVGQLRS